MKKYDDVKIVIFYPEEKVVSIFMGGGPTPKNEIIHNVDAVVSDVKNQKVTIVNKDFTRIEFPTATCKVELEHFNKIFKCEGD